MSSSHDSDRLNSWKDIARYLGRSVRTVRRWEDAESLPVHRHMHRTRASVYAYKSEIDAWRTRGEAGHRGHRPDATEVESSIVVLPFVHVGRNPDEEYIADGFTDEVIAALSVIRSLRVISRTSSMTLKGTKKSAGAIGSELAVSFMIEATVRTDAARVRVTVQLIDTAADNRVWSDCYEGTLDDVFAIQESISRKIVDALALKLSADEERKLSARPIPNVIAWQCAQQARQSALRWRKDAIDDAIRLLNNGLKELPDSVELVAELGRTWLHYREAGIDVGEEPIRRAEECAARIGAGAPSASVGLQLSGWIHYAKAEITDAVRQLRASLEGEPNDPDALSLLANCYAISGRVSSAREYVERLLSVDPLTPLSRCMPGWVDALEGRFERAIAPYRDMFEMDPGNPMARLFYVWILALNDRRAEVRTLVEGSPAEVAESLPARVAALLAAAIDGRTESILAFDPGSEMLVSATDVFPRFLAESYARAGMAGRSVAWWSVAVDRGFINYPYLAEFNPFVRFIENDADYQQLLERVRERWQAFDA